MQESSKQAIFAGGTIAAGVAVGAYLIEMAGLHPDTVFYPAAFVGIVLLAGLLIADRLEGGRKETDAVGEGR